MVIGTLGVLALLSRGAWAETGEENSSLAKPGVFPGGPEPLTDADFAAWRSDSPFLRPIDLSQTLVLKGISRIEGNLFATLLDRASRETHVISRAANAQGWTLMGIAGDPSDLKTVTAQISGTGGEVFTLRFEESQLTPPVPAASARNGRAGARGPGSPPPVPDYREGVSGDGFRGPPPPEIVSKLSKLSQERRDRLIRQIGEIRDRHPELGSQDRQALFSRMLDRALKER